MYGGNASLIIGKERQHGVERLFESHQQVIYKHTDRMFAVLMLLQWLGGIIAAFWIAPLTWIGPNSQTNIHIWSAIFLGAAITSLPITLALWRPGHRSTRYIIAAGQMLMSALLIHLTGGRLETHFHIFGSLAFLSCYRDWRVLIPATLIVITDHLLRGAYWPESIYGLVSVGNWRWVEHSAWVLFEDIFLFIAINRSVAEMWKIARSTARFQNLNEKLENKVQERTLQLEFTNTDLNNEIAERKLTEEALRESEKHFSTVIESANDAIISIDQDGIISSWNNSARQIFGYESEEALGTSISILFPTKFAHYFTSRERLAGLLASGLLNSNSKAIPLDGVKKGGIEFPTECSFSAWETSEGIFYTGIVRDVTQRRMLENQLTYQALHDPLTKLANRVLFGNRVKHALEKVRRNRTPVSIMFLDLDNFKIINDSMGHSAGDDLLISVARRLCDCLRPGDTAARLGGDEFAILVEDASNAEDSIVIAKRIQESLRAAFTLWGREVFIGSSIGIVTTRDGGVDPAELFRNADTAMYAAKKQGKDRYVVFNGEMIEASSETSGPDTLFSGIPRREGPRLGRSRLI